MGIVIIPVLILFLLIAFIIKGIKNIIDREGLFIIMWLLISGRHHSGRRHTSATFWRDSDGKVIGIPEHRITKRHHRAQYKNVLRSIAWITGWLLFFYGLIRSFRLTISLTLTLIAIMITWFAVNAFCKIRKWYVTKPVVGPLAQGLASITGDHVADVEKSVSLKPGYLHIKSGDLGTISFPATFTGDPAERSMVESLVSRRIPVPIDFKWRLTHPQSVRIVAAPAMPEMISWDSMIPVMSNLGTDEILLGIDRSNTPRIWAMRSEDPHMFVSAPSRRGKTTIALSIIAQILRQGGSVTAIDPKAVGLDTVCTGQPHARVYSDFTDVQSLWDGITLFRKELAERIELFRQDRTIEFPRMTLVLDEVSVFNAMSVTYWNTIKPPKSRAIPPIWDDIAAILFTGAQFNVNACLFGQRIDFRTLAGLTDSFGTRLIAGFDKSAYKRLIGLEPIPVPQRPRGRFLLYQNGDTYPTWIQTVYGSEQEMRDYAFAIVANPANPHIVKGIVTSEVVQ